MKATTFKWVAILTAGLVVIAVLSYSRADEKPAPTTAPAKDTPASKPAKETPASKPDEKPLVLKTELDKVSYGIGIVIAKNFKQQGFDVEEEILIRGLRDALNGKKPLMTDEEIRLVISSYTTEMKRKQEEISAASAEKNKKEGEAFLAKNKKKEGVVTLPSGLQYKIIKAGDGKKPKESDTVECNYRGTLIDGTEFDSSYARKQPIVTLVSGVIAGWKEALPLMPVGSKWQLFVPSDLAYGSRSPSREIGPNSVLIFEIELISIK